MESTRRRDSVRSDNSDRFSDGVFDGASDTSSQDPWADGALDEEYFPRIVAIFYSIFHPTDGPQVVYQVPEGSIATSQTVAPVTEEGASSGDTELHQDPSNPQEQDYSPSHQPLFDFRSLSEYIIPKAALCGRLVSCTVASHGTKASQVASHDSASRKNLKILSHPMILYDQSKYPRNSFLFNLAFVFDGRADIRPYEPVVRKCARELRDLEVSFAERSQNLCLNFFLCHRRLPHSSQSPSSACTA